MICLKFENGSEAFFAQESVFNIIWRVSLRLYIVQVNRRKRERRFAVKGTGSLLLSTEDHFPNVKPPITSLSRKTSLVKTPHQFSQLPKLSFWKRRQQSVKKKEGPWKVSPMQEMRSQQHYLLFSHNTSPAHDALQRMKAGPPGAYKPEKRHREEGRMGSVYAWLQTVHSKFVISCTCSKENCTLHSYTPLRVVKTVFSTHHEPGCLDQNVLLAKCMSELLTSAPVLQGPVTVILPTI